MRLLFVLFLLALPAFAQAGNVLQFKLSESEVERDPSITELRNTYQKAAAAEQTLKDKRQELVERNTAMAGEHAQMGRTGDPNDLQKSTQDYQKKFADLNAELAENNGKIPAAEKETAQRRQELKLAMWEARLGDAEYGVYSADGMDWLASLKSKKMEKRPMLRNREGKKFFLDTPQDLKKSPTPGCSIWLKDGEVLAIWQVSSEPPKDEKEPPMVKATSLGQIYFLERPDLPKDCPYGKMAGKEAVK